MCVCVYVAVLYYHVVCVQQMPSTNNVWWANSCLCVCVCVCGVFIVLGEDYDTLKM